MKCEYCDNPVPNGATRCPSCGAIVSSERDMTVYAKPQICNESTTAESISGKPAMISDQSWSDPYLYVGRKNHVAYVLLAIFLGEIGVHNFYVGRIGRGIAQLLITILSLGMLFWISWLWAVVEACSVSTDGRGLPFE